MRHTSVLQGLGFPEGPVALPDGKLAFVDMRKQNVLVWNGTSAKVIAQLPGAPNGATLGSDGMLYVANNGGVAPETSETVWTSDAPIDGRIQRLGLDGSWTDVTVGNLPGPAPHRPNDLCFGPDGWLYFTDPKNWETVQSLSPDESQYQVGTLCRTDCQGTVELIAEIPGFPNGLAFMPGGGELLLAQTIHHRLIVMKMRADRSFAAPTLYCEFPPYVNPDGFCFDTQGNLYLAGSASNSVIIIGPNRQVNDVIETGPLSCPTNVCLQSGKLWITFGLIGELGYMPVEAEPLPLYSGFAASPTQDSGRQQSRPNI
jgi:gluconolactonase